MKNIIYLPITIALLVLLLPVSAAFGQEKAVESAVKYQSVFEVADPPDQFEVVQFVEEFGHRAWLPEHAHGGQGFVTVLEGAVAVRVEEVEKTYQVGETFVEPASAAIELGNLSTERARLMFTFLLPKDAELTTRQHEGLSERTPVVKYHSRFEVPQSPGPFNLAQTVINFAPGTWSSLPLQGGQGLATVLEGAVTVQQNGLEQTYQTGEMFVQTPGVSMIVSNNGAKKAQVAVSFLLSENTESPTLLPDTGGEDATYPVSLWLLLTGAGLIAGGWFIQQRRGRV